MSSLLAHFRTADVANECPIIEQKQTSCVLTFRCRQDLQAQGLNPLALGDCDLLGSAMGGLTNCAMMKLCR